MQYSCFHPDSCNILAIFLHQCNAIALHHIQQIVRIKDYKTNINADTVILYFITNVCEDGYNILTDF